MRALVWIVEDTWEATVAEAAALLPAGAHITLLHVAPVDVEEMAVAARQGLLGRHRGRTKPRPEQAFRTVSDQAARQLLGDARSALGREAAVSARRGHIEHVVVEAAADADLLVLARDGDPTRPGPRSLGPPSRFVVDHAPCPVLLVWPDGPPPADTVPQPPRLS